jgi:hypothetical protein
MRDSGLVHVSREDGLILRADFRNSRQIANLLTNPC